MSGGGTSTSGSLLIYGTAMIQIFKYELTFVITWHRREVHVHDDIKNRVALSEVFFHLIILIGEKICVSGKKKKLSQNLRNIFKNEVSQMYHH